MALLDMFKGKQQKAPASSKAAIKTHKIAKKVVKAAPKAKSKPKPAVKQVKAIPRQVTPPKVLASPKIADEKAWELLREARIPVAPYMFVRKEADVAHALKKVGTPAVMKVSGASIIHKSELGGIRKDISTEEQALETFRALMKIKGAEKVQFQKQLSGTELIVGAKSDPQFGTIVSVGLGGIYVELLKDVTFRVVPIGAEDAMAMLKELKGYEILTGARGQTPIRLDTVADVIVKLGRLAVVERVREMDINPLFCSNEGCWAADVRIMK